jgi:hypothetical protein
METDFPSFVFKTCAFSRSTIPELFLRFTNTLVLNLLLHYKVNPAWIAEAETV